MFSFNHIYYGSHIINSYVFACLLCIEKETACHDLAILSFFLFSCSSPSCFILAYAQSLTFLESALKVSWIWGIRSWCSGLEHWSCHGLQECSFPYSRNGLWIMQEGMPLKTSALLSCYYSCFHVATKYSWTVICWLILHVFFIS